MAIENLSCLLVYLLYIDQTTFLTHVLGGSRVLDMW
jgi:hypothetical protein